MTPITRFYRSCDPDASLKPGDLRYADFSIARADSAGGGWRRRLGRDLGKIDRASTFLGSAVTAMREMLKLRADCAPDGPVEYKSAFASPDLEKDLIHFCGGHLRTLMILVRQCCSFTHSLPITRDVVDAALRDHVLASARRVKDEWFGKLAAVHRTHDIVNDPDYFEMLRSLCILAYANGVPQYGVEPAIQRLPRFQRALGQAAAT